MPKDAGDLCNDDTWEAYKYVNAPHVIGSDSPSGQFQYRDTYCKNVGKIAWLKKSLPDDPPLGTIRGAFLARKGQTIDIGLGLAASRDSWWYIIEDKSVFPSPWLMSVDKVQVKD